MCLSPPAVLILRNAQVLPPPPAPPSLTPHCVSLGRNERRTKGVNGRIKDRGSGGKGKGNPSGETGRETGETAFFASCRPAECSRWYLPYGRSIPHFFRAVSGFVVFSCRLTCRNRISLQFIFFVIRPGACTT